MASVQVTIAGRSYRMACGDGEEHHLEALAAAFDGKIADMRGAFGEIGDMRLHVMAALTLADDIAELKRRNAALEAQAAETAETASAEAEQDEAAQRQVADALNRMADRIERLAHGLVGSRAPGPTH